MKKKIKEYHIEAYWAEESEKRQRAAELKQKFIDGMIIGGFLVLHCFVTYEFLRQLFEVL